MEACPCPLSDVSYQLSSGVAAPGALPGAVTCSALPMVPAHSQNLRTIPNNVGLSEQDFNLNL